MRMLLHWLLSAATFLLVAHVVPGFYVRGFGAALIASLVFGLVNATLGLVLKILTFPLTIVTFGLFLLVVNAFMLKFAATLVPGFEVSSFGAAFMGAFLIFILNMLWRWAFQPSRERD